MVLGFELPYDLKNGLAFDQHENSWPSFGLVTNSVVSVPSSHGLNVLENLILSNLTITCKDNSILIKVISGLIKDIFEVYHVDCHATCNLFHVYPDIEGSTKSWNICFTCLSVQLNYLNGHFKFRVMYFNLSDQSNQSQQYQSEVGMSSWKQMQWQKCWRQLVHNMHWSDPSDIISAQYSL